jgi:hypothetical protein
MKKNNFLFNDTGQTLVETLIALSIGIVIITSMTIAVISSLNNATYSKNQNLATQYAQEGMEIVKQMQVSNYQTFSTLSGRYCLAQTCSTIATSVGICGVNVNGNANNCATNLNNNFFIRQVDVLAPGAAQAKCLSTTQATVSVLWTDGKCSSGVFCHSEQVTSCFSNINAAPIP